MRIRFTQTTYTLCALAALIALGACGDDPPNRDLFDTPSGQSLALSDGIRAVHLTESPELLLFGSQWSIDAAGVGNVVLEEQLFSEPTHLSVANGQGAAAEPRFFNRIPSTYDAAAIETALAEASQVWWVLDLQRLDREWLVDWEGLVRDEPENRETSFTVAIRNAENDGDYTSESITYVIDALAAAPALPNYLIIGTDLELQYLAAPDDWPALAAHVEAIANAVKAAHPEIRVGVGFNWSTFMSAVVPRFENEETIEFGAVRAAWEAVIDPMYMTAVLDEDGDVDELVQRMDVYGFSAIPDTEVFSLTSAVPETHFVGISQMFDESPERALPVGWVRVGWPANASTEQSERWLSRVLEGVGDLDVPVLSWWGYANFDADGYCVNRILAAGGRRSLCNRGLYSDSGAPQAVADAYFE